jgi:hypothetical protein
MKINETRETTIALIAAKYPAWRQSLCYRGAGDGALFLHDSGDVEIRYERRRSDLPSWTATANWKSSSCAATLVETRNAAAALAEALAIMDLIAAIEQIILNGGGK